ncbi:MAG: DNA cytosine methyltransferase [Candidatus Omnitrophica bacterium]|nr:DNA cytosine methyltransferase [Candidatus Omnitrophota bacterium]
MNYIDLFAGAGGLSEGFVKNGFIPISHVEMDSDACLTLKTRLAYHYLSRQNKTSTYYDYLLSRISREQLYNAVPSEIINSVLNYEISEDNVGKVFKDIRGAMRLTGENRVDVIIGGPPCQAYSLAGRSVDRGRKKYDLRKHLYKLYARFLTEFRPSMFVFENVPGLLSADQGRYYVNLKKYFRRIGYFVEDRIIDASTLGVIQKRKRVIIIGWSKYLDITYPDFGEMENVWTVKDILYDLPVLGPDNHVGYTRYRAGANEYLKNFEIRNGFDYAIQNITRPHNSRDLKIYKMVIEFWEKEGKRLKNNEIPEKDRTQRNVHSFLDRFKVVAENQLSHTLLAHIAKDGHYYIHPDKQQLRSLSVREAARIQSFPDNYFFEGSRSAMFRQIGNAVPPLMAYRIAQSINRLLRSN